MSTLATVGPSRSIAWRSDFIAVDWPISRSLGPSGAPPYLVLDGGRLVTAHGGIKAHMIGDRSRRYELVLRLPDARRSPLDLARTLIDTPAGRLPVSAIATVEETDGPNMIGRENGRRRIVVYGQTEVTRDLMEARIARRMRSDHYLVNKSP